MLEDAKREPMSYARLITGATALAGPLSVRTAKGEAVGVMLPNVNAVVVTLFALSSTGRVPAMLNYTAGLANLTAACRAAEVRTIVTARAFVEQAKLEDVVAGLEADGPHYPLAGGRRRRRSAGSRQAARADRVNRFAGRTHRKLGVAARPTRPLSCSPADRRGRPRAWC